MCFSFMSKVKNFVHMTWPKLAKGKCFSAQNNKYLSVGRS